MSNERASASDGPPWVPGVRVEVSMSIEDPEELGATVAGLDADAQALFFIGLARGFESFDSLGLQLCYLAQALRGVTIEDRRAVERFVRGFAEFLVEAPR